MAWWDKLGLGKQLVRPGQTYTLATTPMFEAEGDVLLTSIDGEVVDAVIPGAPMGNCSIETDGGDIASPVAITDDLVGQRYSVATAGGALDVGGAPMPGLTEPVLIPDGETIDVTITGATTGAGHIKWDVHYLPVTPGARLVLV